MYNSLVKLMKLSNSSGQIPSAMQTAFSSHPATEERAARMKSAADSYTASASAAK